MKSTVKGVIYKIFPIDEYSNLRRRKFWLKEINVPKGQRVNTWEMEVQYDLCDTLPHFNDATREVICSVEIRGKQFGDSRGDRVKNVIVCYDIKFAD